ncbi:MAG: transposase [Pseudolabrys sp.]
MATRIPASQRTREELLTALIEGRLSTASGKDELVKLATRLIVEEALEGEAGDAVGRDYYEHGAQPGQGYRNGYRAGRLKTAEGAMEYSAPQIAGRDEPYRSAIREHLKGQTQGLEDLAIEMLARGLSVRDIEDAFKDETGRLLLSKTAVSQLGERLWEDYQAFVQRDLSENEIAYLLVDGIAERLRPGARREPVLAAWGFTAEGRRVLLHLMAGSKEDSETVTAFFEDMKRRGLNDPPLVTSDGAAGIIKAVEVCFPAGGPPALPCSSHAQSRRQAAGGCVAGVQGARAGGLSGAEPGDCARAGRRPGRRLQPPIRRQRGYLLHGRLRGLHRALAVPGDTSAGHPDHEPTGAAVCRGAQASKDNPECIRRAGGPQADVRRSHPRGRSVEIDQGHRVRASSARGRQERARPRIRGPDRHQSETVKGCGPRQNIQHSSDLTGLPPSQHDDLLSQHEDLGFHRRARPEQIDENPKNQSAEIQHPAEDHPIPPLTPTGWNLRQGQRLLEFGVR